jgi:hypothetical protein
MMPGKSVSSQRLLLAALLIAFVTTAGDAFFHTFFSSPEETFLYFVAKFINAFIVSLFVLRIPSILMGAFVGAVAFDILVGFYYGLAYYAHNPALSCCFINAPHINGLPYATYATIEYFSITNDVLGFILLHFAVYFFAFLIVAKLGHLKH